MLNPKAPEFEGYNFSDSSMFKTIKTHTDAIFVQLYGSNVNTKLTDRERTEMKAEMEIFGKVLNLLQARLYAASLQSMVDRKSSDISSVISKMETKISELKNQVEEHKKALSNTNNKSKERQVLEAKISLGESFIGKLARDITDLRNPKTYTENPEWNDVPYLLMSINKNEKTDVISAEQDFSASLIRLCANTLKKKDGTPIEIMGKQLIDKDGNINFEMVDMIDANRYWLDGAKEYSDMENEYNYLKKAATVFKDTQNVVERQKEVLEGIKESYASFEKVNGRIMDLTNAKIDINASSFASKIVNFRKNKDQKNSIDSEMETIKELEGKLMNQIMETAKSFIINLEHYRIVRYEADPKEFPYASNNPALDDKQMREALGKHFNDIVFSKNASLEEKKAAIRDLYQDSKIRELLDGIGDEAKEVVASAERDSALLKEQMDKSLTTQPDKLKPILVNGDAGTLTEIFSDEKNRSTGLGKLTALEILRYYREAKELPLGYFSDALSEGCKKNAEDSYKRVISKILEEKSAEVEEMTTIEEPKNKVA